MPTPPEPDARQLERELTFDLEPGQPLPSLADLLDLGQGRVHHLHAVYLDTPDLLLVRHGITLRRREGGADEGWHLKLPAQTVAAAPGDLARWELHAPLSRGPGRWRVPPGHLEALAERLGQQWSRRPPPEQGLVPVAALRTRRCEVDLVDGTGRTVAALCDDSVQAEPAGQAWRELEVELVDGAPGTAAEAGTEGARDLLAGVAQVFAAQGLSPADSPSKLSRALGDRPARAARGEGPDGEGPAADVVLASLREQVAAIHGWAQGLRVDAPESVHKTRVATRRLRSALRTFRPLLDREVTDPLRQEVRWFSQVLGAARDAEVMRSAVLTDLAELPADLWEGPSARRLREELDRVHAQAHAALVEVLDGARHTELLDRLMDLLAGPPWRGRARERADEVLPALVGKAVGRAERAWQELVEEDDARRLHLVHELRKRAKAVRYAHEALAPALGDRSAASAAAWEEVTEALGAAQDTVVIEERLRELAHLSREAGEPDVAHGVLVDRQVAARGPALATGRAALRAALAHEDVAGGA